MLPPHVFVTKVPGRSGSSTVTGPGLEQKCNPSIASQTGAPFSQRSTPSEGLPTLQVPTDMPLLSTKRVGEEQARGAMPLRFDGITDRPRWVTVLHAKRSMSVAHEYEAPRLPHRRSGVRANARARFRSDRAVLF
jgi:hypothetical protein